MEYAQPGVILDISQISRRIVHIAWYTVEDPNSPLQNIRAFNIWSLISL